VIFSHVLYQLSYLGTTAKIRPGGTLILTSPPLAVQSGRVEESAYSDNCQGWKKVRAFAKNTRKSPRSAVRPALQSLGGMTTTNLDIDNLLGPQDGRFIVGIFNYCDRRCERCAFSDRCRLFFDLRREEKEHPDRDLVEQVEANLAGVVKLLNAWCEQHGIDPEKVQREVDSEAVESELRKIDETRADPLLKTAEGYSKAAYHLLKAIDATTNGDALPEPIRDAIETIRAHILLLSSKIHRALSGFAVRHHAGDESPVQNDWNGSAKVARVILARSKAAWERLIDAGQAPEDSPIRRMPQLLERIDHQIAERFPRAMAFIRPGFDDPVTPK
jgi:hypothetical protein